MNYSNAPAIIFCRRLRNVSGIVWMCILAGVVFSCQNVQPQIDAIASQIALLEQKCSDLGADAAALQSLAEALKQEDELVSFTPTYGSDGKVTGYTIEFRDAGRISVRDGQSYISAATDQGRWWWTIGGAWMTDSEGNRIEIGGDIPSPSFKFEGRDLLFSCDGGVEWQLVGTIEKPLIESVREDASQVIITLGSGETVTLCKPTVLSLTLGEVPSEITAGETVEIPYSVVAPDDDYSVITATSGGWIAKVVPDGGGRGKISITAPDPIFQQRTTVILQDGRGKSVVRIIEFENIIQPQEPGGGGDNPDEPGGGGGNPDEPGGGGETPDDPPAEPDVMNPLYDAREVKAEGGTVTVSLSTNLTYTVSIDAAARSWVSVPSGTKAVRTDNITFAVAENTADAPRTALITFASGTYSTSVILVQEAGRAKTYATLKFRTSSGQRNQLDISYSGEVATIVTTGTDPYVSTETLSADLPPEAEVLTFEYTASSAIDDLQLFFNPIAEKNSTHQGRLEAASNWTSVSFPIARERRLFSLWGSRNDYIRFDFGNNSGITIKVRNITLRSATNAEKREMYRNDPTNLAKYRRDNALRTYLSSTFSSQVGAVTVEDETITITGHCNGTEGYYLAEVPPYEDVADADASVNLTPIGGGDFFVTLDRYSPLDGFTHDRLLSAWAIVKQNGDGSLALASHGRHADSVSPLNEYGPTPLKTKKGLGGYFGHNLQTSDLDELEIGSVTINIPISHYMSSTATSYNRTYCGVKYYYHTDILLLDAMMKQCQSRGISVAAIILVNRNTPLAHPESSSGYYAMPDMTTAEAVNRYAACLDFLAFRYSRSDGRYGRIDKWILHNEVDMGTSWTNMGAQHLNTYMHEYVKSLRLCHDIARSYNPNAEVMASFTHNWMQRDDYCAKEMLDILLDYSRTEGDFHWGVALHPYPQSLSNPKTWNDSGATWSMNTKYITFKNLEVIDHWIKQPEHKFRNSEKRSLWLSENGANSPSYSDSDLANQAACAAWALYKVSQLDGIDAMQWHNWSDNPEEGVKIGLRTQDLDPKPAYYVYKAAYTSSQESVFAPYLPVIGVSSWPQIMRTVE